MNVTGILDYEDAAIGCPTCGLAGKHKASTPGLRECANCPCVAALRDVIANIQLRGDSSDEDVLLHQAAVLAGATCPAEKRLAIREIIARRDRGTRIVMLDGERMSISTAADQLGVTVTSLYYRIYRRMRGNSALWDSTDLREMGVVLDADSTTHAPEVAP